MPTVRNRPSTSSSPLSNEDGGLGSVAVVHSPFEKGSPATPQTGSAVPAVAPVSRPFPGPNPFAAVATSTAKSEATSQSETAIADSKSSDEPLAR